MSRRGIGWVSAALLATGLWSCAPPPVAAPTTPDGPPPQGPQKIAPHTTVAPEPLRALGDGDTDPKLAALIRRTLGELTRARGLHPKRPVAGERLGRDQVIARIMAKTERDLPKGVLDAQGDLLRGLGLVPADYRFVDGIYDLIRKNVAGFYDEDGKKMFLLDDIGSAERETLVHELEHAIQDQQFDLDKLIEYKRGDSDRVTAAHALAEGDAMSAMFEVMLGNAFMMSPGALRFAMVASVAIAEGGAATPRVLQASLIAPYVDGFTFVQALRKRGGWGAVNEAFRNPPKSTEQLLHLDKFDAREPAIAVPKPPLPAGDGWAERDSDTLGEQGLRMVLEQWVKVDVAAEAAAGWGGDRYLVAERATEDGTVVTTGWHLVFDDERHAKEAEDVLRDELGKRCVERKVLGPIAYRRQGAGLVLATGPFLKKDGLATKSAGRCADLSRWVDAIAATR